MDNETPRSGGGATDPASQPDAATPAPIEQVTWTGTPASQATDALPPGVPPAPYAHLPADLRVPWTWLDLLIFFFFAVGGLFVMSQVFFFVVAIVVGIPRNAQGQPDIPATWLLILQTLWYSALLLYLYLLVRLRFAAAFWKTSGFRDFRLGGMNRPMSYVVLTGAGMITAMVIAMLGGLLKPPGEIPIERLFQQRQSALMVLLAAVIVAPLVEELLFRGWLYPVVARTFGVAAGVAFTGSLFGLIHAPQLGWHWQLVGLLVFVGVFFTYVRARSGSVLPAYFLHLGYNAMQAIAFIIGTSGLRNLPPASGP
ncbi:MAG: lysostaphin resistance A-like protein [Candidatus Acidiferrales bacterium]